MKVPNYRKHGIMKLRRQSIYLAGRYRSKWGALGKLWHIYKAGVKGIELAHQGYVVFNPIVNWGIFGLFDNDHEFWIAAGLKLLKDHEIIYMMKGWESSAGAKAELLEADKRGMDIIYEYKNEYLHQFSPADIIRGYTLKDVEAIIDSNPNWGKLAGCTEPVTVPYKLEPEVKL